MAFYRWTTTPRVIQGRGCTVPLLDPWSYCALTCYGTTDVKAGKVWRQWRILFHTLTSSTRERRSSVREMPRNGSSRLVLSSIDTSRSGICKFTASYWLVNLLSNQSFKGTLSGNFHAKTFKISCTYAVNPRRILLVRLNALKTYWDYAEYMLKPCSRLNSRYLNRRQLFEH